MTHTNHCIEHNGNDYRQSCRYRPSTSIEPTLFALVITHAQVQHHDNENK
ncbi:hypothetical protein MGSAQ_000176 [marine sediment metagenome]|uniref:Uncharacterized protein n=1 Tax=marine sediment metagenome TaxID=412755 RepID=A0A1B6NY69_9ZZZZ